MSLHWKPWKRSNQRYKRTNTITLLSKLGMWFQDPLENKTLDDLDEMEDDVEEDVLLKLRSASSIPEIVTILGVSCDECGLL
jgi:hypothetical protein